MAFQHDNEILASAKAKFQRVSARKARLLADLIRGKKVEEALTLLTFTHRPSAQTIMLNVLKSAIANAKTTAPDESGSLKVGEIKVDDGPIMYRMQPMSRGRAGRIRKRFCHITLHLVEA